MSKTVPKLLPVFVLLIVALACVTPAVTIPDPSFINTAIAQTYAVAASQTAEFLIPITGPESPTPTTAASATPFPTYTLVVLGTPEIRVSVETNCRTGPGNVYRVVGVLQADEAAQLVGRSANGNYWAILNPDRPGEVCWISDEDATITGFTNLLPVFTPPPTSTPTRTPIPVLPAATRTRTRVPTSPPARTPTRTSTPPLVPTVSSTPSATPTGVSSASPTVSSTFTFTPTAPSSPSPTVSSTSTLPPSTTPTDLSTLTPTPTATSTPSQTPTPSPTPTGLSTLTPTATSTPSQTATASSTSTPTGTPTPSATGLSSLSPTPTATSTPSQTPTASSTSTPTPTATSTPSQTPTASSTSTPTPTVTGTLTPGFTVSYSGMESCPSLGWWVEFQVNNTGQTAFDFIALTVTDPVTGTFRPLYSSDFTNRNGCATAVTLDTFSPGTTHILSSAPFTYNPSGQRLNARILLCANFERSPICETQTIDFTP